MTNNKGLIFVVILLVVGAFFLFGNKTPVPTGELQSTSGNLIRTVPIDGNGEFQVEYKSEISGTWVAVIVDTVSSNCKFANGKNEYKTVVIGNGPTNQITSVTGTNCVFDGDYDFYSDSIDAILVKFGEQTVQ